MSDTAMTDAVVVDEHPSDRGDGDDHHEHASDSLYIRIALILGVLTAFEVALPYVVEDGPVLVVPLLAMMVVKFIVIASYFMHLKFDNKIVSRVFYTGLVLAVSVYVVALMTFTTGLNPFT